MHTFLLEQDLWVPSTFAHTHDGCGFTWSSPQGDQARLDYVCIPCRWKQFDITSWVGHDIDTAICEHDHLPVAMTIVMAQIRSTTERVPKLHLDMRKCQGPVAAQQFCSLLEKIPDIPWSVGASYHAELLTQHMREAAQQCFRKDASQPRQRYISDETWKVILMRKQLMRVAQSAFRFQDKLQIMLCFRLWKSIFQGSALDHVTSLIKQSILAIRKSCWWSLHQRNQLHQLARAKSRQDRIEVAHHTAERFLTSSRGHDTKALDRDLKPLLGQAHRKQLSSLRPLPAVRLSTGVLAPTPESADERWREFFCSTRTWNSSDA